MNSWVATDGPTLHSTTRPVVTGQVGGEQLQRRARRWGILAILACPCHLPLVATLLAFVGFGGSAAALRDHLVIVSVLSGIVAAASLAIAVHTSRAANACRLPPPPERRDRAVGR